MEHTFPIKNLCKNALICAAILAQQVCFAAETAEKQSNDVAYLAYSDVYWQVWTAKADGSQAKQISTSAYDKSRVSWYPDGRHLLVNGNQGEVVKLDTQTQKETPLPITGQDVVDAVISPDGSKIAYSRGTAGTVDGNDIWLMDVKTNQQKPIVRKPKLQHQPTWSADSKTLYFLSTTSPVEHDIWQVTVEKGEMSKLTVGSGYHLDIAVSKNGQLAWSGNKTNDYEIWIKDVADKTIQLTNHPGLDGKPTWSAGGSALLFESVNQGVPNIWHIDINAKKQTQITKHKQGARLPVWFTGGAK